MQMVLFRPFRAWKWVASAFRWASPIAMILRPFGACAPKLSVRKGCSPDIFVGSQPRTSSTRGVALTSYASCIERNRPPRSVFVFALNRCGVQVRGGLLLPRISSGAMHIPSLGDGRKISILSDAGAWDV